MITNKAHNETAAPYNETFIKFFIGYKAQVDWQ
jgi:hypothetical protein